MTIQIRVLEAIISLPSFLAWLHPFEHRLQLLFHETLALWWNLVCGLVHVSSLEIPSHWQGSPIYDCNITIHNTKIHTIYCIWTFILHSRDQVICEVDVIHILTEIIQNILIERSPHVLTQYIYMQCMTCLFFSLEFNDIDCSCNVCISELILPKSVCSTTMNTLFSILVGTVCTCMWKLCKWTYSINVPIHSSYMLNNSCVLGCCYCTMSPIDMCNKRNNHLKFA